MTETCEHHWILRRLPSRFYVRLSKKPDTYKVWICGKCGETGYEVKDV
jgi:rubrerythrin